MATEELRRWRPSWCGPRADCTDPGSISGLRWGGGGGDAGWRLTQKDFVPLVSLCTCAHMCTCALWTVLLRQPEQVFFLFFDGPDGRSGCRGGSTGRCRRLHGRGRRGGTEAEAQGVEGGGRGGWWRAAFFWQQQETLGEKTCLSHFCVVKDLLSFSGVVSRRRDSLWKTALRLDRRLVRRPPPPPPPSTFQVSPDVRLCSSKTLLIITDASERTFAPTCLLSLADPLRGGSGYF